MSRSNGFFHMSEINVRGYNSGGVDLIIIIARISVLLKETAFSYNRRKEDIFELTFNIIYT